MDLENDNKDTVKYSQSDQTRSFYFSWHRGISNNNTFKYYLKHLQGSLAKYTWKAFQDKEKTKNKSWEIISDSRLVSLET